ncbi:hypothetical protein ACHAW6_008628 [Cyclotella cf. meneghiniana]
MVTSISTRQNKTNYDDTFPLSSDEFICSFSDSYSSPRSSFESAHRSERSHNVTDSNIVTPTNSPHLKTCNHDNEANNVQRLLSELHNLQEQSSRQNREYERAIRRALLENEYVRKINAKLVAKLESQTSEEENTKTSLKRLESVAQCYKDLMVELVDGKRNAEERAVELEGRNRTLARELEITADISRKQQMEMDKILSESREKDAKLKELEREGHETDGIVTELRNSLLISSHTYNKLRIELNTVIGERENARLKVEELLMEKDDDVLRRVNAEAAFAKAKRELNELRQRLNTFSVAQKITSLQGENDVNGMVMILGREKGELQSHAEFEMEDSVHGKSTWEIVTTAVEQSTSEHAAGLSEPEKEKENFLIQLQSMVAESAEREAKILTITTAMEKRPPGDVLVTEDGSSLYASRMADLVAENPDLREQVATKKDALQDLTRNSRALVDITADRDMPVLKLKNITAEKEESDLLLLTTTEQIGTSNTDVNHLSKTHKTTRVELAAANEEVSAMKNELILTKELLEKANAMEVFLRCQLKSTNEALDSMTLKFKSAAEEIALLKVCIDDFSGVLKPAETGSGENRVCCRGACDSNYVSSDDAKLESVSDSAELDRNQNYHISIFTAMKSVVQSLQSQNNDLLTVLACAKNETEEKSKELCKLESANNVLNQSNQQLMEEIEKASIKCDHFQLQLDQASDAAERKISFLNTKLLQQMKEHNKLDNLVMSLEKEKEDALAHISVLTGELCKASKSASVQQKELQQRFQLCELDRKSILAHSKGLTSELKNATDKVASLMLSSRDEKKSSESLQNQLSNLKVMLDESTVLLSKKSKEIIILQEHNAKFHEKLERRMLKEKELCRTIKLLKNELDDCKLDLSTTSDQLKLLEADNDCLHEQVKVQNDEIVLLRLQKNDAEAHVKGYECSVRSLCLSYGLTHPGPSCDEMLVILESECSKQRDRTNSMEMELEAVQDENAILEQQVHFLSKEVSKCNRENRELSATIAALKNCKCTNVLHSG